LFPSGRATLSRHLCALLQSTEVRQLQRARQMHRLQISRLSLYCHRMGYKRPCDDLCHTEAGSNLIQESSHLVILLMKASCFQNMRSSTTSQYFHRVTLRKRTVDIPDPLCFCKKQPNSSQAIADPTVDTNSSTEVRSSSSP
jgi:hypothetical protein